MTDRRDQPARKAWTRIWFVPILIAAATAGGLIVALLTDGPAAKIASCFALAVPLAVVLSAASPRRG
jgi:hypothetical protein